MDYMKQKYGDERKTKLSQDLSVYSIASSLKAFKDARELIT